MSSLRAKQILIKAAQISLHKEKKFSQKEIEQKINQIKHLASRKTITKTTLRRELRNLEKRLPTLFELEKKYQSKEKEITKLKNHIKNLRQQLTHCKDADLRKKVNKLSHFVGDFNAQKDIKKEVAVQKNIKKKTPLPEVKNTEPVTSITLEKIKLLQEKILNLKHSGHFPPEKIEQLEIRLTEAEKKINVPQSASSVIIEKDPIKHRLLFDPPPQKKNS